MKLKTALSMLSNIKPLKTRHLIVDDYFNFLIENGPKNSLMLADSESVFYPITSEISVHVSWMDENLLQSDSDGDTCITPEGARQLIDWYQRGVFELKKPSRGIGYIDPDLIDFSQSTGGPLPGRLEQREATLRSLASQPLDDINQSDFSYSLLNRIFWNAGHRGSGSFEMTIGGTVVTKTVLRYSSNSGKSHDSTVVFSWIDSEGQDRRIEKSSQFVGNRRNDSHRNWGLPE